MGEMNVRTMKKSVVLSVLCLCGMASVSACASNLDQDSTSPLASELQALVDSRKAYPRLDEFPADPVNVPTAESVRTKVVALENTQVSMANSVQAIDWQMDGDADATAAEIRRTLTEMLVEAPTAQTPAEIEAFAQSLRDRAKAPPPIDRPMR